MFCYIQRPYLVKQGLRALVVAWMSASVCLSIIVCSLLLFSIARMTRVPASLVLSVAGLFLYRL